MRTNLQPFLPSVRQRSRRFVPLLVAAAAVVALGACSSRDAAPAADSAAAPATSSAVTGPLKAPHGGILVSVGNGAAQLEFNVDTTQGVVMVHVLDGAAKEPLRLTQGRIDLTMLDLVEGAGDVTTVLAAKANPKTNESFESTSVFIGFVPQLVGRGHFRARVQRIDVGGQIYTDIPVAYPPDARA